MSEAVMKDKKAVRGQKHKNAIRKTPGERVFDVFNYILLICILFACVYPFWFIIINSVSAGQQMLIPKDISFYTYRRLFFPQYTAESTFQELMKMMFDRTTGTSIGWSFFVSVARVLCGTCITILCSSMFAYLVTQQKMYGRRIVYRFVTISMYLSAGLIPWYLTMSSYGLQNNFLLYVLPGAVSAYYTILIKTYIESLPISLEESAQLDGAGFFTIFFRIILPLSKPIIATIAVFAAVGHWNSWSDNYFLVNIPELKTMQLELRHYITEAQRVADMMRQSEGGNTAVAAGEIPNINSDTVRNTVTVVTVIPILFVYPFMQRYFIKGIMMGAVKG